MTRISDSVADVGRLFEDGFEVEGDALHVTSLLVDLHHYADATPGVSWQRCIEAASKQYAKEKREAADETALPET